MYSFLNLINCRIAIVSLLVFVTQSLGAVEFRNEAGSVKVNFDTTISYGVAMRMQDRDPSLVGKSNGGTGNSVNNDDGNLNYKQGSIFSSLLKVNHELDLKYENLSFFGRGYYFYDSANANRNPLGSEAIKGVGHDVRLLDAYVKGDFDPAEHDLQVRLGNQVVSWGESTFIPGGINVINSVDLARLRTPGSEIREALLPTPMLWLSERINDRLTLEAFSAFSFKKIQIDPRGTYFSTNDTISGGGNRAYSGTDQHVPGVAGSLYFNRGQTRDARNNGEYGLALRIQAPTLNETEFGLFVANYHHRIPVASFTRGGAHIPILGGAIINLPTSTSVATVATYFEEHPEDVKLYGISFNTAGPAGIALQGEYSYRPNLPLQIATGELTNAALGLANSITGGAVAAASVALGTVIPGYRRVPMQQLQMTATKVFSSVLRADQLALIGEVGYTYLDLPQGVNFAGYGETAPAGSFGAPADPVARGLGFATRTSWGYLLGVSADYNDAIGAVRLSPRLNFSQAVRGVSPTWNEGIKSASLGLSALYKQKWKADIAYTAFFGGRNFHPTATTTINTNGIQDRDYLALSLSYSF